MYLGSHTLDDLLTFYEDTHTPSTSADVDADAVPTYRIYEEETGTPILTGSMAKLDDAGTLGFYSEQVTLSTANGLELGKTYGVRKTQVIGGVDISETDTFQMEAHVDATSISAAQSSAQDIAFAVLDELALIRTTIATLATQISFTLAGGSIDDDAYVGGIVVVTDSSSSVQKAVGRVSAYAGSTKTITLETDPAIFVMAVGDAIFILAPNDAIAAILADTANMQPKLGTPSVSVSTDIAAIKTETALIVADTNELQGDNVPGLIAALNNITAASVWAVGTRALTGIGTGVIDATARNEIADSLLNRDWTLVAAGPARTLKRAAHFLRNKVTLNKTTGAVVVMDADDTTESWTASATLEERNAVSAVDPD